MLDSKIRPLIDPPLNRIGVALANRNVEADSVTLAGLMVGVMAGLAIIIGFFGAAIVLILLSRLFDGLDGAIARATEKTDFGGYLDICCDYLFYGLIPLAFVLHDPASNGISGAILLAAFYFNGATFLAYATLAERYGLETETQGEKTLYYSSGLLEGTETIAFFILFCLLPSWFAALALIFAVLTFLTGAARIWMAFGVFGPGED